MIKLIVEDGEVAEVGNHLEKTKEFIDIIGLENCEIEYNYNKNELYYCFLPMFSNPSWFIKNTDFFENSKSYSLYKSGYNIKFVLCNFVECGVDEEFEIINKLLLEKHIKKSDVITITENLKTNDIETYGIRAYSVRATAKQISNTMNQLNPYKNIEFISDREFLFQCFNNVNKPHRYSILSLLKYENLLENTDWSLLNPQNFYPCNNESDLFIHHTLDSELSSKLYNSYNFILNNGKSKYSVFESETVRDFKNANGVPTHAMYYKNNPYRHAYINIVTESQYEAKNLTHITEKTIQPFYFQQIPIFIATDGFVKTLKKYYNFDLFEDLIDHSYDNELDPQKRMLMIIDELKKLKDNKDKLKNFFRENNQRFINNQIEVSKLYKEDNNILETFKKIFL